MANHNKKTFALFIITLVLIFAGVFYYQISEEVNETRPADKSMVLENKVLYVIDGDTFEIWTPAGGNQRVRLIGIDTPEIDWDGDNDDCYAQEASDFLNQVLDNKKVVLERDGMNENTDKYGRLLRYVYLDDGTFVNELLLREGYARLYDYFPFKHSEEFAVSEQKAKEQKLGLWGKCE